jgi:multiple sugar transport system permease protein
MMSRTEVLDARPRAGLHGRPAPGRRGRKLGRDTGAAAGFLSFSVAGFTLFTLIPMVLAIYVSFFNWPLEGGRTRFVGLGNYRDVLSSYGFWRIVLNVLYFVGAYVPLNLIVSLTLAALLGPRTRAVKGKAFLRVVFFLPVVTPLVASSLLWSLIYNQTGILNTALGWFGIGPVPWLSSSAWAMPSIIIMSVWLGFGYNMILFVAGMTNIPDSLYEAAAIDGAGPFRQFFKVTLPLLSPLVFFGTMMTLITSFQVFTQAYILTNGGPGNSSTTLVLQLYDEAFRYFRLGSGSAIAVLLAFMILIVTGLMFMLQRRLVHYEH